jgi:hypothetical protein
VVEEAKLEAEASGAVLAGTLEVTAGTVAELLADGTL